METKEWRCRNASCGKKLGEIAGTKVYIRFARGHEYIAHLPATASCRSCGTLTEHVAVVPAVAAIDGQRAH